MKTLPEKTIERLSVYRRSLLNCYSDGKEYIYSHELANLHNITSVQVRRDLMLIGYSSTLKKGYDVKALIDLIGQILDSPNGLNVAVVGVGNLGRAITTYFRGKRSKLQIVASFDTDPEKINSVISGVKCYSMKELETIIREKNISVAILTVPPEYANSVAELLAQSGIKGLLNYTSVPVKVSTDIVLDDYDMTMSLEKVAYFVKQKADEESLNELK
ncbi:MAG: redox-sensing transcriptional repressor Rex [Bacteroidales bacterium]